MRPYSTCAASSSPLTSLSRTAAHEASLLGTILLPYFSSNFITDAITTDAQSVSGMKPTFTSVFSGASEPAAHTPARSAGSSVPISETPAAPARSLRRGVKMLLRDAASASGVRRRVRKVFCILVHLCLFASSRKFRRSASPSHFPKTPLATGSRARQTTAHPNENGVAAAGAQFEPDTVTPLSFRG